MNEDDWKYTWTYFKGNVIGCVIATLAFIACVTLSSGPWGFLWIVLGLVSFAVAVWNAEQLGWLDL